MMRRWLASPLFPLLALLALSVWPLLRAGYPLIGDGGNHLYRLVEFDHLLRNGIWFPRWATDLCYGYGCPLFNFYPPLVYYLGALFHALGLSYGDSLLAVYALALALAISGAYVLARKQWGLASGLIAASAYGSAPYLYFNALARGALPETLGLGLLPWALYAYVRLVRQPAAKTFIAATLFYAAVLLSHILSALLAAPLLIIFAGLAFTHGASPLPRRQIVPASFFLAFCLSAYFILPALLETGAVQIYQLTAPGDLDFRNNFLRLSELLALPHTYDPRLVFIAVPPALNLGALSLAVMGLFVFFYRIYTSKSLNGRPWEFGLGLSFVGLGLLTLPITRPLWEVLPIANLIQFPWRLVGPASLLLALLAASAFHSAKLEKWSLSLLLLPASFFLFCITWTFAPDVDAPTSPTVRDLAGYEASTGQFGTTSAGEFLPKEVRQRPTSDSLSAAYAERDIIERLGPLPNGVTLIEQSATPSSATATLNASAPSTLTFNIFYFPGWQARVDGAPVLIQPSDPEGLITVPINAGQHTLTLHFGLTPLRAFASGLSLLTLALLVFIAIKSKIWRSAQSPTNPLSLSPSSEQPSPRLVALTSLALLLIRVAVIDGRETLFAQSRFDGATISTVEHALDVNFDNQLVLLGFDQSQTEIAANNPFPLTLYWRAQNIPKADYSTTLQVVDEFGNRFGQSDSQHPGRTPTSRWRLDQYARDEHHLTLLPGTPPGIYTLTVGVYQFGGSGLSILDENQIPQGQTYPLGQLTVTRATRPPTTLDAAQPLDLAFGPLTLIGQTLNTDSPQAGDDLIITLFWRAEGETRPDLILWLELVGADGATVSALETTLAPREYPTSQWQAGEVVRLPVRFRLPATAAPGPAQLRASLRPIAAAQTIASLTLRVPERSFTLPAPQHPRAEVFNETMKLLGYDVTPTGLTLYWQALALMETRYTVFVHTLDAEDRLLAQVDAVPVQGARPTTGWLPGEVVTDTYMISLAGAAKIEIGMYNPLTQERLGTIIILP